jgi:DNA polymerase
VVADLESFYSDDFSLSKMTTESYIRDPRFCMHGIAVKWSKDHDARWYTEPQWRQIARDEDWSDVFLVAHHHQFDGLALSHHYGVHPAMRGCTLAMARLLLGNHLSVSLDAVRKHFGIAPKQTPYNLFRGKHWHEMTPQVQEQVAAGACDEVESIWRIFGLLLNQGFPRDELPVIDIVMDMFCEPALRADVDLLARTWERERDRKRDLVDQIGVDPTELQSAAKFQALLEAEGVEIEYKDGKNGPIPAFAKNDPFMQALLDDEDDRVRGLAEARLGLKSTMLQTRCETLGWAARRGPLPVYLLYAGAGTLRFSGGDKTNWQNFKRKDEDSPKEASPLRRAVMAPEGYWLAPVDLAQIEYRVLSWLAGQEDALEEFRRGDDPYVNLASIAYGYPVTPDMKLERGTGKQLKLSCGYMAGAESIQKTARLGIYGPPVKIELDTALRWRNAYRDSSPRITDFWRTAGRMIARIAGGPPTDWGIFHIRDKRVYLPGGCPLIYDTLEYHVPTPEELETMRLKPFERDGYWRVRTRAGWKTFHAGKLTQNLCEAVSRLIVTQAAVRIKRMGFHILNIPHDELLVLIPKGPDAEVNLERCKTEMVREPVWLPGIPLACEGELSERYEK